MGQNENDRCPFVCVCERVDSVQTKQASVCIQLEMLQIVLYLISHVCTYMPDGDGLVSKLTAHKHSHWPQVRFTVGDEGL